MEWQEILNAVAKEEAQERDEDIALFCNYDSEDEEFLSAAFHATNIEKREYAADNEAIDVHYQLTTKSPCLCQ